MNKGLLFYLRRENGHKKAEALIKKETEKILSFLILNTICLLMNTI